MFDVTYAGALLAGLISFVSPCVLPLVPFYLSYLTGVSAGQLTSEGAVTPDVRRRALAGSVSFSLGVIVVFVGFGATATLFGQLVREYFDLLRWIAAGIIIVMGLHFLGILRIGILYRQFKFDAGSTQNVSLFGAFLIGFAFAFGWTPCVGPVLAAILFTAAGQETAAQGASLLFTYALGMTLPFMAASLFVGPFLGLMSRMRQHLGLIEKLMGLLLLIFGIMIATDSMSIIANWMLETVPWFSTIG